MMPTYSLLIGAGAVCLAAGLGSILSYVCGYNKGVANGRELALDPAKAITNEVHKGRSRGGAVPEFMAPGELAEVVEMQGDIHSNALCVGCRYAGRYLVPGLSRRSEAKADHG